jgi:hypothetical protein
VTEISSENNNDDDNMLGAKERPFVTDNSIGWAWLLPLPNQCHENDFNYAGYSFLPLYDRVCSSCLERR